MCAWMESCWKVTKSITNNLGTPANINGLLCMPGITRLIPVRALTVVRIIERLSRSGSGRRGNVDRAVDYTCDHGLTSRLWWEFSLVLVKPTGSGRTTFSRYDSPSGKAPARFKSLRYIYMLSIYIRVCTYQPAWNLILVNDRFWLTNFSKKERGRESER